MAAQKLEDECTVADVKDLNKLALKVNASEHTLVVRPVRLVKTEVLTAFDASCAKKAEGARSQGVVMIQ